jgi:hypothetical protein
MQRATADKVPEIGIEGSQRVSSFSSKHGRGFPLMMVRRFRGRVRCARDVGVSKRFNETAGPIARLDGLIWPKDGCASLAWGPRARSFVAQALRAAAKANGGPMTLAQMRGERRWAGGRMDRPKVRSPSSSSSNVKCTPEERSISSRPA